jgi:hypothetical protein
VTYYWYKFIDQPVFAQFNWTKEKRAALQSLIEKIHARWPIDRDYMPAPTYGKLVSIDDNLDSLSSCWNGGWICTDSCEASL